MLLEFLPRGCVPARRGTCVLNCQGVIMPWRGSALLHLCLCQVYYQTKYSRVHGHRTQAPTVMDGCPASVSTLHTGRENTSLFYVYLFLSSGFLLWLTRREDRPHAATLGRDLPFSRTHLSINISIRQMYTMII